MKRFMPYRSHRSLLALVIGCITLFGASVSGPSALSANGSSPSTRYIVRPHALPATNGIRLDGQGGLLIAQNLFNRVQRLDLRDHSLVRIADESDHMPLKFPDDLAIGPDGRLYFTEPFERTVTRMDRDGSNRVVIARGITDGRTVPNGIAFRGERLFVTDMVFDTVWPSGMWEILLSAPPLPDGSFPIRPIVRGLPTPNAFDFGPDGIAYVPTDWHGSIYRVDVDDPSPVASIFASGFGNLTALKVDPQGNLVVVESDTGKVWRVSRSDPDDPTLLAQGRRGFDNLDIDDDGTIYVSSFLHGNIGRVNESARTITPLLREGSLALAVSLDEEPDGSLLVADLLSLVRVASTGEATRLYVPFLDTRVMATGGVVRVDGEIYNTEFLPPRIARLCRLVLTPGNPPTCDPIVSTGMLIPWHVRRGPAGHLLVSDQGAGRVLKVNLQLRTSTVIASNLNKPAGLAYDQQTDTFYVSESREGRVRAFNGTTGAPVGSWEELQTPEGLALDGRDLLVVEAAIEQPTGQLSGQLTRIDLATGQRSVVVSGLPARPSPAPTLPPALYHYTSDVLVRSNGNIVVSVNAEGSLIEIMNE